MPNITIKNIPDKLYKKLKKRAEVMHRSLNNEIINSLDSSFKSERLSADEIIRLSDEVRSNLGFVVREEELNYAKNLDRK